MSAVICLAELGISSRIVARAEETFDNEIGTALLQEWGVPENYIARYFVLLGYVSGEYPGEKPRRTGRSKMMEGSYDSNRTENVSDKGTAR